MPYQIEIGNPPIGRAIRSARKGEMGEIAYFEFSSSEDGDAFIQLLEGIPSHLIRCIPQSAGIRPSQVDHMVAIIYRNGACTVFINERSIVGKTRTRRALKKGEAVYDEDMLDFIELEFEGIEIPVDAGILTIVSKEWRKFVYYDFGPLLPTPIPRSYSLPERLGSFFNYLSFQDLFKIHPEEWDALFRSGWFPFIGLKSQTTRSILSYIKSGWNPDELLTVIKNDVCALIETALSRWKSHPKIGVHSPFLERAIERFSANDFISCNSILYPRIEGILREIAGRESEDKLSQKYLAESPLKAMRCEKTLTRILPQRFRDYLQTVYFANFEPMDSEKGSRNTIAHGVAPEKAFSEKAACLALLIIEQIYFHLPSKSE